MRQQERLILAKKALKGFREYSQNLDKALWNFNKAVELDPMNERFRQELECCKRKIVENNQRIEDCKELIAKFQVSLCAESNDLVNPTSSMTH